MELTRTEVPNAAPWGASMRYSRAVRVGDRIEVSGTTSVGDDGEVIGPKDMETQVRRCLAIIQGALEELGSGLHDVVRTRLYVTDIGAWSVAGRVHDEVFAGQPAPASSAVGIAALIHPDLVVEIEAAAIVGSGRRASDG